MLNILNSFSTAFDKVPHIRLMLELSQCGIDGVLHGWIKEWLKNRRQYVLLNCYKSSWEMIKCDVSKGSVFGPLLFLIYTKDMDYCIVYKFVVIPKRLLL